MDAVAEEDAFGVSKEILEIIRFTVAIVRVKDSLVSLTNCEVILEILVSKNVATAFSSFT